MQQKINNWALPVVVALVSVLSIVLLEKTVWAAFVFPDSQPGDAIDVDIALNPMAEDLDLNGWTFVDNNLGAKDGVVDVNTSLAGIAAIYGETNNAAGYAIHGNNTVGGPAGFFEGELCLGSTNPADCISAWTDVAGGGGGGGDSWFAYSGNGVIHYSTTTFEEKVGIGTNNPTHTLVLSTNGLATNAELNIQTNAHNYWSLYHDNTSEDLRFWNNDISGEKNLLTLKNTGLVGIGNTSPIARLEVRNAGTEDILNLYDGASEVLTVLDGGRVGIGTANPTSTLALAGTLNVQKSGTESVLYVDNSTGFVGFGTISPGSKIDVRSTAGGTAGNFSGGAVGLLTSGSTFGLIASTSVVGGYAAIFSGHISLTSGNLYMNGDVIMNGGYYITNSYVFGAPSANACDAAAETGRTMLDASNNRLYVCSGTPVPSWRFTQL